MSHTDSRSLDEQLERLEETLTQLALGSTVAVFRDTAMNEVDAKSGFVTDVVVQHVLTMLHRLGLRAAGYVFDGVCTPSPGCVGLATGGGGTSFAHVIDAAAALAPAHSIVITDGFAPLPVYDEHTREAAALANLTWVLSADGDSCDPLPAYPRCAPPPANSNRLTHSWVPVEPRRTHLGRIRRAKRTFVPDRVVPNGSSYIRLSQPTA